MRAPCQGRKIARTGPSARFKPLATLLRERRVAAGLTQTQVASALGWQQSAVVDVESARRRLNVYEFIDYVRAIECDPVDVFNVLVIEDLD